MKKENSYYFISINRDTITGEYIEIFESLKWKYIYLDDEHLVKNNPLTDITEKDPKPEDIRAWKGMNFYEINKKELELLKTNKDLTIMLILSKKRRSMSYEKMINKIKKRNGI